MQSDTTSGKRGGLQTLAVIAMLLILAASLLAGSLLFLVLTTGLLWILVGKVCAMLGKGNDWEAWSRILLETLEAPVTGLLLLVALFILLAWLTSLLGNRYRNQMGPQWLRRVFAGMDWMLVDPRVKQVAAAILVMFLLSVVVVSALMGWRHLPEFWADWIGTIVGVMSTPFFLEASFIFIGMTIVVAINHWRQKRDGDDFVEVEIKDSKD